MIIEWIALEMNRDHSVIFEIASKYCISDSLVDLDGYSISLLNTYVLISKCDVLECHMMINNEGFVFLVSWYLKHTMNGLNVANGATMAFNPY